MVMLDGEEVGFIYKDAGGTEHYEYRGKGIGAYQLQWVAARDKRDVINRLEVSLKEEARLKASGGGLL